MLTFMLTDFDRKTIYTENTLFNDICSGDVTLCNNIPSGDVTSVLRAFKIGANFKNS